MNINTSISNFNYTQVPNVVLKKQILEANTQNGSQNLDTNSQQTLKEAILTSITLHTGSLSGFSDKNEVTIWGKLMGYDENFSKSDIQELKSFINSTKALGYDNDFKPADYKKITDVDAFAQKYTPKEHILGRTLGGGLMLDIPSNDGFTLLDRADLGIEEFKDAWIDYAVRKVMGESGAERISVDGTKITVISRTNKAPIEFQTLEMIEYSDEKSRKFFIELVKDGLKNGQDIKDIMQGYITPDNENIAQDSKNFTPITGKSQNEQTYDILKDEKFAYLRELLEFKNKSDIEILKLMQKIEKNENIVDKKA